jgi:hypothetical protein
MVVKPTYLARDSEIVLKPFRDDVFPGTRAVPVAAKDTLDAPAALAGARFFHFDVPCPTDRSAKNKAPPEPSRIERGRNQAEARFGMSRGDGHALYGSLPRAGVLNKRTSETAVIFE